MKKLSELTDFYYKTLYPTLEKLEEDRKKLRSKIIKISIFALLIVLFILNFFYTHNFPIEAIFFTIFAAITLGGFAYKYLTKDYTTEFKASVIHPLIKAIDETLNYLPNHHLSEDDFVRSDLFGSRVDRSSGNDYVSGNIDDVKIEFSDFHAEKKHKDSKGNTSWSTIFQGLFMLSDFNKNFKGKTVVLPDTAQSTFGDLVGNWLQSKNGSRDELVKMDNPEFEKEFVVYSSDQIEARYILSHSLMKRLLDFKKKSKHPLYISFVRSHIYIAIEYNKDLFEPTIFSSLLDYKVAMEYVRTMHLAIGIVQELKLNEKLWSKI